MQHFAHILNLGSDIGFFEEIETDMFQDVFGVVWDRTIDKDIGDPKSPYVIAEPSMEGIVFPNPHDPRFFANIESEIQKKPDLFRRWRRAGLVVWRVSLSQGIK